MGKGDVDLGDLDTEETELPAIPKMSFESVDEAVGKYVDIRDELRIFQKKFNAMEAEFKQRLDMISMWLREKADELGVDSFKTPHGTAYRNLKETYRIANWDDFLEFITRTGNFQLLEKRVAKNAAREIHRTDKIVPPGLDYFTEIEFNVLRPKKQNQTEE